MTLSGWLVAFAKSICVIFFPTRAFNKAFENDLLTVRCLVDVVLSSSLRALDILVIRCAEGLPWMCLCSTMRGLDGLFDTGAFLL